MTLLLAEVLDLETSHPEGYQELNFSAQLSETNPSGRCKPDKVIDTAISKNTTTPGGLTSFSTKKML